MPIPRPCLGCGALARASWCAACAARGRRGVGRWSWRRLRAQAKARDGHACQRCGSREALAVHHVLPLAEGGRNVLGNLRTLCRRCHGAAHVL